MDRSAASMGRRREEKIDEELLAQLESAEGSRIRVPLPKRKVNEMFAIADQMLGGRRVHVVCEDGESRLARIPGKMRRRQWVREGDLIVVQPWDFQDAKADVKMRYTKTQSLYLSRKGVLPEIVDVFGVGEEVTEVTDDSGIFASSATDATSNDESGGSSDVEESDEDGSDEESEASSEDSETEVEAEPEEEGGSSDAEAEDNDEEDIDSFFS